MLLRDFVIDACAIINLIKGDIAETCLAHINPPPAVTPAVKGECEKKDETTTPFRELLAAEVLCPTDELVTADAVVAFMEKYDLGAGESECILACIALKKHFWADDRRARDTGIELLTRPSVIGTAGVLRDLVVGGDLPQREAVTAYALMRARGGFLPSFPAEFFCKAAS